MMHNGSTCWCVLADMTPNIPKSTGNFQNNLKKTFTTMSDIINTGELGFRVVILKSVGNDNSRRRDARNAPLIKLCSLTHKPRLRRQYFKINSCKHLNLNIF